MVRRYRGEQEEIGKEGKRQQIRVFLFVKQNKGRTERLKKQQAKVFLSVVQRKYGLCPNPASVRATRTLPLKFAICVFKHKYLYIHLCFSTRAFAFTCIKNETNSNNLHLFYVMSHCTMLLPISITILEKNHFMLIFYPKIIIFSLDDANCPNFRRNVGFHICCPIFVKLFAKKVTGGSDKYEICRVEHLDRAEKKSSK